MTDKRCPDCGVTLEAMETRTTDGFGLRLVTNEPKEGFFGNFGAKEKLDPVPYVCPECGLVRTYAES